MVHNIRALGLYQVPFYLPPGQSMWLDAEVIKTILEFCRTLFPVAKYATSFTPTYPLGQLGYVLCSMDPVSGRGGRGGEGKGRGNGRWQCGMEVK